MKSRYKFLLFQITLALLIVCSVVVPFKDAPQVDAAEDIMVQPLMSTMLTAAVGGASYYGTVVGSYVVADTVENKYVQVIAVDGTISNMYVRCSVAPGGVTSRTATLRVNGADTALTVAIGSAVTDNYNTSSSVAVVAGDYVVLKVTNTGAAAASTINISMEFRPSSGSTTESLIMGCSIANNVANRYSPLIQGLNSVSAIETVHQVIPTDGTISDMYIRLSAAAGAAGKAYKITFRLNSVDTAISFTITAPAVTGSDVVNSVPVSAGDLVDIKIEPVNAPTVNSIVWIGLKFTADEPYESIVMGNSYQNLNTGATRYTYITAYSNYSWDATNVQTMAATTTFKKMYISLSAAPDNGAGEQSYKFSLFTGQATDVSVTIKEAETSGYDYVNEFEVITGEYISVICVPTLTPTAVYASWSFVVAREPLLEVDINFDETRLYEYYNTGGDAGGTQIYGATLGGQVFTVLSSHTVTMVKLPLQRTGNPGIVTVSIRLVDEFGLPRGDDLSYSNYNADLLGTAAFSWISFQMNKEVSLEQGAKYCILLSAPQGSAGNIVQWYWDIEGFYPFGNAIISTDGGSTWSSFAVAGNDYLFEIWGKPVLYMISAKVFRNYKQIGDWLIVCNYLNKVAPYYPNEDVTNYFTLQLRTDATSVVAVNPVRQWGLRPGSIYLAAAQVHALEWSNTNYRVVIMANYNTDVSETYMLKGADWSGQDLDRLDEYCIDIAHTIEDNADNDPVDSNLTVNIATRGEVLNDTGAVYFNKGIPGLMQVRPNIFAATTTSNEAQSGLGITYRQPWQEMVGVYVAGVFNDAGEVFGVDGKTIGFSILIFSYLGVMAAFGMGHNTIALVLTLPFLIMGLYLGFFDTALFALIASVVVLLMVRQLWFSR